MSVRGGGRMSRGQGVAASGWVRNDGEAEGQRDRGPRGDGLGVGVTCGLAVRRGTVRREVRPKTRGQQLTVRRGS